MTVNTSFIGFFTHASLLVKFVMLILLAVSLVSWTLIFYRGSFLKWRRKDYFRFMQNFAQTSELSALYQQVKHYAQNDKGIASIFYAGFKEFMLVRREGIPTKVALAAIERNMNIAQMKEMQKLEDKIAILATIGSVSPYVGLFGTVWGIMTSFQALGQVQQATISMVAPGISEALIATAMGLFAAIPAVIAYNRFSTQIDVLINHYETSKQELLALFNRKLLTQESVSGVDYEYN